MSKGTWGAVIGGTIGFIVSGFNPAGAYWGATIGGAIGASYDVIQGRRAGEMSSPSAQEGEPIPLVFGSARVRGRLMSAGVPDIRTEQEGGKGGPGVENETAYLSYSILICESSELRNSSVTGILMVFQNNKIVYDMRPEPAIPIGDSMNWIQNKTFYFGEETQGTDPTEEMIHGVGNVPAYRGLCRMVVSEENVTQHGGGIPVYEFVPSQCVGGIITETISWFATYLYDPAQGTFKPSPDGLDWTAVGTRPSVVPSGAWDPQGCWLVQKDGAILGVAPAVASGGVKVALRTPDGVWTAATTQYDPGGSTGRPIWTGTHWAIPISGANGPGFPRPMWSADGLNFTQPAAIDVSTTTNDFNVECMTATATAVVGVRKVGTGWVFRIDPNGDNPLRLSDLGLSATPESTSLGSSGTDIGFCCYLSSGGGTTRTAIVMSSDDDGVSWTTETSPFAPIVAANAGETHVHYSVGLNRWFVFFYNRVAHGPSMGSLTLDPHVFGVDYINGMDDDGEKIIVCGEAGFMEYWTLADGWQPLDSDVSTYVVDVVALTDPINTSQYTAYEGISLPDLTAEYFSLSAIAGGPGGYWQIQEETGTFRVLDDSRLWVGPCIKAGQDNYGSQTYWESVYTEASTQGYLPLGWTYEVEYPDVITTAFRIVVPEEMGDPCAITLSEIMNRLDARAGIPPANSVTTALEGIEVPGYAIDAFMTVSDAKELPKRVYFFDSPEHDDAIRYRLRGGPTDFTIDPDDLIVGEEANESGIRGQTVEYPKKLHIQYIAPTIGYKPMKQTAERISPDIRVKGEEVASANITLADDTAKRAADIGLKVMWTEREDSRQIAVPMHYLHAVASDTFSLSGRRYRITELRIEAGALYIQSVYDRISAYSSTATGVVGPDPTGQSNIAGPTAFAVMNLPALRVADDSLGVYTACSGQVPGWHGAHVYVSRDGANFLLAHDVTVPCVMGSLLATLPDADPDFTDTDNTIVVQLVGEGSLDSATHEQVLNGANAAAILWPDGTAEIVQFEVATEVAPLIYDLTILQRGRKDTTTGLHAVGAQFVLLNESIRFVPLSQTDIGLTLTFRAASNGTPVANNDTTTITLTTMESQREWSVTNLAADRDSAGDVTVTWDGRPRLGTNVQPQQSSHFIGYRVEYSDGVTTVRKDIVRTPLIIVGGIIDTDEITIHEYTTAEQAADFGSPPMSLDIEVSAVNELTGAGPSEATSA